MLEGGGTASEETAVEGKTTTPATVKFLPVVPTLDLRSVPRLPIQRGAGQEVVVKRFPAVPVKRVDGFDKLRVVQPVVAEQLPDVGPVLLLDMPVVVFLVWPGSGEPERLGSLLEVAHQVPIVELRAVVGVEATQVEGQRALTSRVASTIPWAPLFNTARLHV